ncbi:tRNA 2-thiouridine(34) synthase MnmA [Candidatus Pacebacteria bacterium]|nr:tRNA 2-thiouridine(34) synthase MnmA [Candidatus Paceibacterota bacterium]
MKSDTTVFVGLSGGVDSSVAALRLINQGYRVVGVFIKVWQPDWLECNWEQERLDAMRVAAHLEIPFLTCNAEEAYKREVADYFIAEYKAGRTPNPDVMCNQAVKFGAFIQFAKQYGADFVATGHYAQMSKAENKSSLLRGVDKNKDQSYFLWTLTQEQLSNILLPVGDSPKAQIRQEATAAGIPVATKKDSQGVCFLGHIDIPEFLSHYIDLAPGRVLDETGAEIGSHAGSVVYTIGQRHGFALANSDIHTTPHYVIARNVAENTITVSTTPPIVSANSTLTLDKLHWISDAVPSTASLTAQFRYRQTPFAVDLSETSADSFCLSLKSDVEQPAAGQSCVLYDGDVCLGGGIIA